MKTIEISKAEARHFLINYHGLGSIKPYAGSEGILNFIKQVGCIQYDPLDVVGRNADLVLQSRIENYKPIQLETLLYQERSLIDGWDKMMAIYSREDWPYFKRVREKQTESVIRTLGYREHLDALQVTETVKNMLAAEGPKLAREIDLGNAKKGGWGHGKLSSVALDYLFHTGELGIYNKKKTQKVYDLTENLLPESLLQAGDPFASDHDFYKWYAKRRIGSVGMLWEKEGGAWLGHFLSDKGLRLKVLAELVTEGEIDPIQIEGIRENFYIRREDLHLLKAEEKPSADEMRFLAPLDNLLWDRTLIETLFDFKYTWEVYVPQAKRKYGYYVLPVLYGNQLVGRFEPEKHRNAEALQIKNWWWEPGVEMTHDLETATHKALDRFCKYLGAAEVTGAVPF